MSKSSKRRNRRSTVVNTQTISKEEQATQVVETPPMTVNAEATPLVAVGESTQAVVSEQAQVALTGESEQVAVVTEAPSEGDPIEEVPPKRRTVFVILMLTNNHLSNVKSLQSIYRQNYEDIFVIAYNDCTSHFESERFGWNLENKRGSNIRQVIFEESKYQYGEYAALKKYWNQMDDGLTITLHAGEYFKNSMSVSECVKRFDTDDEPDVVVSPCVCYTEDMKRVVRVLETKQVAADANNLRDCMVMAKTKVLQDIDVEVDIREKHVMRYILNQMRENSYVIKNSEQTLCIYSNESIDPQDTPVPDVLVDKRLYEIAKQYHMSRYDENGELLSTRNIQPFVPSIHEAPLLERLVTLKRLTMYLFITLAMLMVGGLLTMIKQPPLQIIAWIILGIGGICALWTFAALAINLLYKQKKRKGV